MQNLNFNFLRHNEEREEGMKLKSEKELEKGENRTNLMIH